MIWKEKFQETINENALIFQFGLFRNILNSSDCMNGESKQDDTQESNYKNHTRNGTLCEMVRMTAVALETDWRDTCRRR